MQFSHALIALVAAGLASAQLPDIPPCALSCFVDALGNDGCTSLTDFKCHCSKPELPGKITPCVEKSCPEISARVAVSNAVVEQCSKAGVPIELEPIVTEAPSTTAAPTEQPTETAEPSTEEPSEEPTEEPTAAPTEQPTETEAPTTAVPTGTGSGVPTGTGSYTVTGHPTASTPAEFPGAGSNIRANVGGIAAALLGLAAYL
uniref:Proline-rich antigen n=1 Tax=Chrysosporium lucknowense TaxID=85845 RepID=Q6QJA4_9EURO|nr:proline-rich antigen [Chrysosporium lucknowense]